jgi:hypothetical protein
MTIKESDPTTEVIIPFRKRNEVLRRIESFRSQPPSRPLTASAPMRIDGEVNFANFLEALRNAGLLFKHDVRTGEFVLLPDPEAKA